MCLQYVGDVIWRESLKIHWLTLFLMVDYSAFWKTFEVSIHWAYRNGYIQINTVQKTQLNICMLRQRHNVCIIFKLMPSKREISLLCRPIHLSDIINCRSQTWCLFVKKKNQLHYSGSAQRALCLNRRTYINVSADCDPSCRCNFIRWRIFGNNICPHNILSIISCECEHWFGYSAAPMVVLKHVLTNEKERKSSIWADALYANRTIIIMKRQLCIFVWYFKSMV